MIKRNVTAMLAAIFIISQVSVYSAGCSESDSSQGKGDPMTLAIADKGPAGADASSSTDTSGIPQISFPETTFDFGTVAQQGSYTHTFVVQNKGDAPLKLIKAKGS
jgi:hypothetical protein